MPICSLLKRSLLPSLTVPDKNICKRQIACKFFLSKLRLQIGVGSKIYFYKRRQKSRYVLSKELGHYRLYRQSLLLQNETDQYSRLYGTITFTFINYILQVFSTLRGCFVIHTRNILFLFYFTIYVIIFSFRKTTLQFGSCFCTESSDVF